MSEENTSDGVPGGEGEFLVMDEVDHLRLSLGEARMLLLEREAIQAQAEIRLKRVEAKLLVEKSRNADLEAEVKSLSMGELREQTRQARMAYNGVVAHIESKMGLKISDYGVDPDTRVMKRLPEG